MELLLVGWRLTVTRWMHFIVFAAMLQFLTNR